MCIQTLYTHLEFSAQKKLNTTRNLPYNHTTRQSLQLEITLSTPYTQLSTQIY
jgi:hypothetical protein